MRGLQVVNPALGSGSTVSKNVPQVQCPSWLQLKVRNIVTSCLAVWLFSCQGRRNLPGKVGYDPKEEQQQTSWLLLPVMRLDLPRVDN